jgi:type IV secretion system protein VirB10
MIDGVVQSAASRQTGGTTVVTGGTATSEILGEVLKSTVNIPPTVTIAAGTRVQALVARDIDFRRVYELRDLTAGP